MDIAERAVLILYFVHASFPFVEEKGVYLVCEKRTLYNISIIHNCRAIIDLLL